MTQIRFLGRFGSSHRSGKNMTDTRTVNIALTESTPGARTIHFVPDISALSDASLLLHKDYPVTTAEDGTASIDLPVKISGMIKYHWSFIREDGGSHGAIFLEAGDPIDFTDLLAANGEATTIVQDYVNEKISNTPYGPSWDGDTTHAPTHDATYDAIESLRSDLESDITDLQAETEALSLAPMWAWHFRRPFYTLVPSDVNPAADTIRVPGHRLGTGEVLTFDTAFGGVGVGTQYNAIIVDTDHIRLAASSSDAYAGVKKDITSAPSGNVTMVGTGHNVSCGNVHDIVRTYNFVDADVDAAANTIKLPNHKFVTGHALQFNSAWGGLTTNLAYYAIYVDKDHIMVANSTFYALSETPIDLPSGPGGAVSLFSTYGDFWFDCLVIPGPNCEYFLSIGPGGAHRLLAGCSGGLLRTLITGNISVAGGGAVDGPAGIGGSDDSPFVGKPLIFSVGRYNNTVVMFLNGAPCGHWPKPTGAGILFGSDLPFQLGGSDHSNKEGWMFWARYWEHFCPFPFDPTSPGILQYTTTPPSTYLDQSGKYLTASVHVMASPEPTSPNIGIPLLPGNTNNAIRNKGQVFNGPTDFVGYAESEKPQVERLPAIVQPNYGLVPLPPSPGAKITDTFQRNDIVKCFGRVRLGFGMTEIIKHRFDGRVAVVTGAGNGLGAFFVDAHAAEQAQRAIAPTRRRPECHTRNIVTRLYRSGRAVQSLNADDLNVYGCCRLDTSATVGQNHYDVPAGRRRNREALIWNRRCC